jgi:hypothetical protein
VRDWFLIAISGFVISCAPSREKPDSILSEEKMVEIFYDLYLLEGAQRANVLTLDSMRFITESSSESILANHGVMEEEFKSSVEYYAYNTEELNAIMQKVVEKLNQKESELIDQASKAR